VIRLSFVHLVGHLDAAQGHTGTDRRFEPEHGPDLPLDCTMILLDAIIQVTALPDPERFQLTSRSVPKAVSGAAGQDGL
jgi:hypothetical protein